MQLNLLVLKCCDVTSLAGFYEALGLRFERERHGHGVEHLSCRMDGVTLEIYPCTDDNATTGARLGFRVRALTQSFETALRHGGKAKLAPTPSPWGARAVIEDPAGHVLELTQA